VVIFTGGVETGQGFYAKKELQIASHVLNISMSNIYIPESATDKVPNPILTGASSTADYCGNAVRLACKELNRRLTPLEESSPEGSWSQLIGMAYAGRVGLSVTSYYTSPAEWTQYSLDKK
jgi:xanthine dehydrogenase/oxidase